MSIKRSHHPDQIPLDLDGDAEIERMIEARVAIRAEADALRWRFRLILVETAMMASLILAAGFAVGQPALLVLRSAAVVGGACLLSGILLIGLSGMTGLFLSRVRRWRTR